MKKETENRKWSWSRLNIDCPQEYKLLYIDEVERLDNFYGQAGSLVHLCLERFAKKEISKQEMIDAWRDGFVDIDKSSVWPNVSKSIFAKVDAFLRSRQEVPSEEPILIEQYFEHEVMPGHTMRGYIDVIFARKIIDYKISNIYKGDDAVKKKMQLKIYAWAWLRETGEMAKEAGWYFIKDQLFVSEKITEETIKEAEAWIIKRIGEVMEMEKANDYPYVWNDFYCKNLCSVRNSCDLYNKILMDK